MSTAKYAASFKKSWALLRPDEPHAQPRPSEVGEQGRPGEQREQGEDAESITTSSSSAPPSSASSRLVGDGHSAMSQADSQDITARSRYAILFKPNWVVPTKPKRNLDTLSVAEHQQDIDERGPFLSNEYEEAAPGAPRGRKGDAKGSSAITPAPPRPNDGHQVFPYREQTAQSRAF
ncbi:hypothetical protein H2199_005488 [Coniosporium tulheliwenetii]|uniref:Uncharacterized protein n=1 Tax=Coniosporium tulheliwenetii TaxID=3383036 RepID=A0ACC2Z2Q2_9PEZI|nr:hypothetical protein H2199_005488 [Cladosporium sp. JES 115]